MSSETIMILGLFVQSLVSGMVGLGIAFAAIPFLALFLPDLVHQVQPLSLLLNGITGLSAAVGFARSKLVDWRQARPFSIICTVAAPLSEWSTNSAGRMFSACDAGRWISSGQGARWGRSL